MINFHLKRGRWMIEQQSNYSLFLFSCLWFKQNLATAVAHLLQKIPVFNGRLWIFPNVMNALCFQVFSSPILIVVDMFIPHFFPPLNFPIWYFHAALSSFLNDPFSMEAINDCLLEGRKPLDWWSNERTFF